MKDRVQATIFEAPPQAQVFDDTTKGQHQEYFGIEHN